MDDSALEPIRAQTKQLKDEWRKAYETLEANPSVYEPYLQNASLRQLDEGIETISYWLDRSRAPRGFAPTFHLAKSLAATSLASALTAVQALRRNEYGFFPNLLVALNQMTSALHSMLIYSDKSEARGTVANLGAKLAEALALVGTAQRELATKSEQLASASELLSRIEAAASTLSEHETSSDAHVTEILAHEKVAKEHLSAIEAIKVDSTKTFETFKELETRNETLQLHLQQQEQSLAALTRKAEKQQDLITALLPKGASAGLASAFALRVGQIEWTKRMWMGAFILSVLVLAYLGYSATEDVAGLSAEHLTTYLLRRLPLAGPLIWLGWFSAIQYGNTLRIQEDYAFKEATSKAFAGYRDHLEHLATVSLPDGDSAMTLLAARTIEILANEPLRVFGRTDGDATPASSILDRSGLKRKVDKA